MISKNEEMNIERCINSVKLIADEIILVDTGSDDRTVEIAKRLGAKVYYSKWNNDFSEARNVSLKHATGEWILFVDCDEEVLLDDGNMIKNLINSDYTYEGYYLRLLNMIGGSEISDAIVFRLFKNKKEYRFKGRMHEQVINSIQDIHGLDCIGATQIKIVHYGYDPKISDTDKKSKRNLDILLSYEEKDKDGYYYYVLGNEYARIEDYDEALRIYNKALEVTDVTKLRYIYYPYLVLNIAKSLYVQKKYEDELIALKKFQKNLPDFKDLFFMETLLHVDCSRLTKAKESLMKYKQCVEMSYEYPKNGFENYYNVAKLYYDLENGIVDHKEKTLTVWISVDGKSDTVVDCIKCVNEISEDIIVLAKNHEKYDTDSLYQYGAKIIKLSDESEDNIFKKAMKASNGRYVLRLNHNNLLSQEAQLKLMYLLKDDLNEAYSINELNMADESTENIFRIFKTNKKITSSIGYEDYLKNKNMTILDSKITIHKKV